MLVKDVMSNKCLNVTSHQTAREAATLMRDLDVGCLPVEENDRLVGIVTDRDIVTRCLTEGKDMDKCLVTDAMTSKCLYCFEEDSIEDVANNMAENKVRRLPVLNKDKRLVGIVSLGDLSFKGSTQKAGEALATITQH